jgi:hypothetical protein
VQYSGSALQAAKKYYWKVQVWDNKGHMAESDIACWQMGLLSAKDWGNAKWIAFENLPDSMRIVPAEHGNGKKEWGKRPDVLPLLRKEFIADKKIMDALSHNPVLGHINTFGGHPVCCAAGMAAFKVLQEEKLIDAVKEREAFFISLLHHAKIKAVRSCGFENFETNKKIIDALIAASVFTDWFLFAANCLRIAPPLTISEEEISIACSKINDVLNNMQESDSPNPS